MPQAITHPPAPQVESEQARIRRAKMFQAAHPGTSFADSYRTCIVDAAAGAGPLKVTGDLVRAAKMFQNEHAGVSFADAYRRVSILTGATV